MKLIKLLAAVAVALTLVNVIASNTLVGKGETINTLAQEISIIEQGNRKLQLELTKRASLLEVQKHIEKAGFSDPQHIVSLQTPHPVALSE